MTIRVILPAWALALGGCALGGAGSFEPDKEGWPVHVERALGFAKEGRPAQAEAEFLAAVRSIADPVAEESAVVSILNHLALLYASEGRHPEARGVLAKALAFLDRERPSEGVLALMTLHNRAAVDIQARDFGPAAAFLKRAAEISTRVSPDRTAELDQMSQAALTLSEEGAQDSGDEIPVNINLWYLFEARTLPGGGRRTSVLGLFHLTTRRAGDVYSWHLLNYVSGPDYRVFFPLYFNFGEDHAVLPPLFFEGPSYWTSPLLLTAHWSWDDGSRTTWVTPLYHRSSDQNGRTQSLHLGPFLLGDDYWSLLPLLSGGWTRGDGSGTTWLTPLFHRTVDPAGRLESLHAGPFVADSEGWMALPLFIGHSGKEDAGGTTWGTPLFHRTTGLGGAVESWHLGPYFEGRDYWVVPPVLVGSWGLSNGKRTTWLTPLAHLVTDKEGDSESFHVGPYFGGKEYWALPPLLSGGWSYGDGSRTTWITPFFHLSEDSDGELRSLHALAFFEGEHFWALPPLLSGSWGTPGGSRTTWISPFFHETWGEKGELESLHLGFYFEGSGYWALPPLLTAHWTNVDRGHTTWVTPFFHATQDSVGTVRSLHVGPLFLGDGYWALPPLLSGSWDRADGGRNTWVTPLFHLARDGGGRVERLFAAPFFFLEPDGSWTAPFPFLAHWNFADKSDATWITPLAHVTRDPEGAVRGGHAGPFLFWERDEYWVVPPLVLGEWTHPDRSRSLWLTPLFHRTRDREDQAESCHVGPFFFWKRDDYWIAPLVISGGWVRRDGGTESWVTPFYHSGYSRDGTLEARHLLNWFEGPNYSILAPLYWSWTRPGGVTRSTVPLLYFRTREASGDTTTSFLWPLFSVREGGELDTGLGMELRPFVYQSAGEDYEVNLLWRLFSLRREGKKTSVMVGPFWWSQKPEGDLPSEFQILGGLVARDCDYDRQIYRYRIFWGITFGSQSMKPDVQEMFGLRPLWDDPGRTSARAPGPGPQGK